MDDHTLRTHSKKNTSTPRAHAQEVREQLQLLSTTARGVVALWSAPERGCVVGTCLSHRWNTSTPRAHSQEVRGQLQLLPTAARGVVALRARLVRTRERLRGRHVSPTQTGCPPPPSTHVLDKEDHAKRMDHHPSWSFVFEELHERLF